MHAFRHVAALRAALGRFFVAALTLVALVSAPRAETIEVTDLAGRIVKVNKGVGRVILGEGRLMYGVGILDTEAPFKRLVGWAEDMILFDPGAWRMFRAKFPEGEKVARFGSSFSGDFSVEKAIALNADLVIFSLSSFFKVGESAIIDKLDKAGIPAIFIDFREQPMQNTVPSITLLGRVFDRQERANAFNDFYLRETRRIIARVASKPDAKRVRVMMERAAGFEPSKCCMTFGNANLGALLQDAGGINWGSARFSGLGGTMNPEIVFAENAPVIIGTGADWAESTPGAEAVPFGYEATEKAVQEKLAALANRKGWPTLDAVKTRRFYSIYHQFYTSPSHLVALQVFAKWLYPDEFKDIDPEATHREYHSRFSPIPLTGVFWAQLK